MADTLPPIDTASYDTFQRDRWQEDTDARISSLAAPPVRDDYARAPAAPATFGPSADSQIATLAAPPPDPPAPEFAPPPVPAPPTYADTPAGQATSSILGGAPTPPSVTTRDTTPRDPNLVVTALNEAEQAGIDPALFVAQIDQESHFDPNAGSSAGARGIAQIVPRFHPGVDPTDPRASLKYAANLMASLIQKHGGDVTKALVEYNGGGGAVAQWEKGTPYGESSQYVDRILSAVASSQQNGNNTADFESLDRGLADASGTPLQAPKLTASSTSQFGDPQLTAEEAYAACGPAAAVRFAQAYGRNPTLKEALDLAKGVGWTSAQGMAGLDSEKALMDKLGVPVKLVRGADWQAFATEAQTGNPVTISTPGHYFMADGYDPTSGKFHVGRSGLDLKGGAEWMSPADMERLMGTAQGGLLADNPQVPAPSHADQESNPLAWLGRQKDALLSGLGEAKDQAVGTVTDAVSSILTPAQRAQASNPPERDDYRLDSAVQGPPSPPRFDVYPGGETGLQQQEAARAGMGLEPGPIPPVKAALDTAGSLAHEALPGTWSDAELLARTSPDDLAHAREVAARTKQLTRDPSPVTDADVAQVLKNDQIAFAYAGTHVPLEGGAGFATGRPTGGEPPIGPSTEAFQAAVKAADDAGSAAVPPTPKVRTVPERPLPAGAEPITLTPAQEAERLRLDKFPEEVRPLIQQAAESSDFAATQRRGVLPDAVAQQMAERYAGDHTFEQVIRSAPAGKAWNAEETRAIRNAVAAQAVKVNDLGAAIKAGDDSSQALAAFFAEGLKLNELVKVTEGAKAEAGRALRAYADSAQLVNLSPNDAVVRLSKLVGGDRDKLLQVVQQYQTLSDSGAGPVQMANFWAKVTHPAPGFEDWFKALRYNSMMSGPRTFEVNAIGNSLEVPWRLARDTLASTARGNPREIAPELAGVWAGLQQGARRFMEVLGQGITTDAAARGDIPRSLASRVDNPLAKGAAQALEFPGRLNEGMDEWARAVAYNMGVGRRAAQTATSEGLKGKAWDARVAELMATPTTGMQKDALGIAERMTYKGDMGNLGRALAGVQQVPYLGSIVLPFLRTVYHITARGVDRSPLGLVGTGIDVARGVYGRSGAELGAALRGGGKELPKGVAPLGERVGDAAMGSLAFLGFLQQAYGGNISGAGPDDSEKRSMLRAQGWQPYSVHIGDQWVSYANWGPVAMPLTGAAALAEASMYAKPGKLDVPGVAADSMRRMSQLMTEQTYLQSVGAIWKGLAEPDRFGAQFVGQFVQSMVPYGSAINTVGQATDPVQRRPDRENLGQFLTQSTQARFPGLREQVPVAQDALGRPAPNEQTGIAALNPLRTATIRDNAVLHELVRASVDIPGPPQDVRGAKLTPDEQRQYSTNAGRYIEDAVRTITGQSGYATMSPEVRQKVLQRTVEGARQRASADVIQQLGADELRRRITAGREKKTAVLTR